MNSYRPPPVGIRRWKSYLVNLMFIRLGAYQKTQRKKLQDAASTTMINPIMELLSRQAQQQEINKMF